MRQLLPEWPNVPVYKVSHDWGRGSTSPTCFRAMLFECLMPESYSCAPLTSSLGSSFAAARAERDKSALRMNMLAAVLGVGRSTVGYVCGGAWHHFIAPLADMELLISPSYKCIRHSQPGRWSQYLPLPDLELHLVTHDTQARTRW
jgi:hypothetical protein